MFRAPCAEFCGQQHARMTLHVVAQPADEFDRWLAHQALPAALPQTPLQARGQQAFIDLRCGVCHTVRGLSVGDAMAAPQFHHQDNPDSLVVENIPWADSARAFMAPLGHAVKVSPWGSLANVQSIHRDGRVWRGVCLWFCSERLMEKWLS